jgi:hypothetical protein
MLRLELSASEDKMQIFIARNFMAEWNVCLMTDYIRLWLILRQTKFK